MLKRFACLIILVAMPLMAVDDSWLDNKDITVKQLTVCEQQDMDKAQKAVDDATAELYRIKHRIESSYSPESSSYIDSSIHLFGAGYYLPGRAEVHGKYVYIWKGRTITFSSTQ